MADPVKPAEPIELTEEEIRVMAAIEVVCDAIRDVLGLKRVPLCPCDKCQERAATMISGAARVAGEVAGVMEAIAGKPKEISDQIIMDAVGMGRSRVEAVVAELRQVRPGLQ